MNDTVHEAIDIHEIEMERKERKTRDKNENRAGVMDVRWA